MNIANADELNHDFNAASHKFSEADSTLTHDYFVQLSEFRRNLGQIDLTGKCLVMQVQDKILVVPDNEHVTVGRQTSSHLFQPDVDLGQLGIDVSSVSRHHISISRRGTMLYVSDLGSTNG